MAVLHEHAAEVPELHRDGHAPPGAQTIDVFAAPLPWRHVAGLPVAGKDLAFLEVDVDGVIPATAAVLQRPDLARAHPGRRRNPPDARVEHRPVVVRFDAPGAEPDRRRIGDVLRAAPAELEQPCARHGNARQVGVWNHRVWHLAHVGPGRIPHDPELQELPDARILRLPREGLAQRHILLRSPAVLVLAQVDQPDLVVDAIPREVDDDVVALGDALLVQLRQRHRVREQVPVTGDLDHRRPVAEGELEESRHAGVQDAEAVLAALHLEVGLVGEVHGHAVAEEPVEFEDVEVQLPVRIPRLVGQHQVDVVVEVAPRLGRAARKPQVHAVVDLLVAPIEAAVEIEHPGVALVHVLRGEAEHVIVEPVRAHRFAPVARDLDEAAAVVGARRPAIGRGRVDRAHARQDDWIVVVVELAGEEEGAGEAVVLRAVVAVVLVRRDRVPPEAAVLPHVRGQSVVVAEQDAFPVPSQHQLGRQRAVEGPQRGRLLVRQAAMEVLLAARRRVDAAIQTRFDLRIVGVVE